MMKPALSRTVALTSCLAAQALFATACARGAFEHQLRAGHWYDAAATFYADSALHRNPDALRRVAHIHATPDSVTWDPERALDLLTSARAYTPEGRVPASDVRLEGLLRHVMQERAARETLMITFRDSLERIREEVGNLRAVHARLLANVNAHDEERALLQRLVARLESDLRERETQLSTLRLELDRLKAIDLTPPVRAPPSTPE